MDQGPGNAGQVRGGWHGHGKQQVFVSLVQVVQVPQTEALGLHSSRTLCLVLRDAGAACRTHSTDPVGCWSSLTGHTALPGKLMICLACGEAETSDCRSFPSKNML